MFWLGKAKSALTVKPIRPGDIVTIIPGQRHKVWQRGDGDLTLLVTCIPPYSVDEVVFVE